MTKFYSDEEKNLLLSLVEKYQSVIECKKTDGVTIKKKQQTWDRITATYNANDVTPRNSKQLKKLWDNIKQRTRKSNLERRNYLRHRSGSPPPMEDDDPVYQRVRSIVPTIEFEIQDSWDGITQKNIKEELGLPASFNMDDHDYDASSDKETKNTKRGHINEEAVLRKTKLEESIQQQRELHKVRMEAAEAEKRYWQIKSSLLEAKNSK